MDNKPVPRPTTTSRPFWDALREHRVEIQQCDACRTWVFYPRSNCPHCLSADLQWKQIPGKGAIYSYTVARVPTLPEFADEAPQLLAVVQLDEGPRINSTLTGVAPEAIAVGMRVRPVFDDRPDATLLRFAPDDGA
jgi:uncharacterized OB-fold protein